MKVQAYLTFGGRCEEALEFYKKSVGAEVTGLLRWKESPDAEMKGPPGYEDKIMNAAFRIGETQLMADDGMGETKSDFKGMTLAIEVAPWSMKVPEGMRRSCLPIFPNSSR